MSLGNIGLFKHSCQTLIERLNYLSKAGEQAVNLAKGGTRTVTAITCMGVAAHHLWNGQLSTGIPLALAVGNEFREILGIGTDSRSVTQLLEKAEGGMEMVLLLNNMQKNLFADMKKDLERIEHHLKETKGQLKKVDQLATQGLKDLDIRKKDIAKRLKDANGLFVASQKSFEKGSSKLKAAHEMFNMAIEKFDDIASIEASEANSKEQMVKFLKIIKEIRNACFSAQELLEEGETLITHAKDKQERAHHIHREATEAFYETALAAEAQFSKIRENTVIRGHEKDCNALKEKVNMGEKLNRTIEDIQRECKSQIKKAKEKLNSLSHRLNQFIKATPGFFVAQMTGLGLIGLALAGFASCEFVNSSLPGKITDWAFGVKENTPSLIHSSSSIKWAFHQASSGYFNRWIKKEKSYTTGIVQITFSKETTREFSFNLNEKSPLSELDQAKIAKILLKNVKDAKISSSQALDLIKELQTLEMARGPKHIHRGIIPHSNFFASIASLLKEAHQFTL
ncbi:MAG: hypothetical protein BGO14_09250 [Chlamydiales bacterium 38-26]|nr:hypothetical protein [Chlamydiales bacterium]OJV11163.1 MAG: hypothetical protein BGO14_09250 [Chlamydiales bacterium 38-26]